MTVPGGYQEDYSELQQFSMKDDRSMQIVIDNLSQKGFDVCLKDWEMVLNTQSNSIE
jgi:GTPase SAR1 family protein